MYKNSLLVTIDNYESLPDAIKTETFFLKFN